MSDSQEIEDEKKFIKQYFQQINELDVPTLKKYFLFVKQRKRGTSDEKVPIKTFINTISEGNGKKAIHFAAARGDLEIFKYIIKKGADINILDDKKNNAFIIAVQHNHIELVTYLIDIHHIDVNYQRDTVSALHLAAQQGSIPMIELLLSAGANINTLSNFGTPLSFAAAYHQNWSALHLIKKGADLNIIQEGMPALLLLLIDQSNTELFEIIFNEYSDKIDVNVKDPTGWSALQLCAEKGNEQFAQILIKYGADVNYENQGQSALDIAVQHQNWNCVSIIREHAYRKEAIQPKIEQQLSEDEIKLLYEEINKEKNESNNLLKNQQYQEAINLYLEIIKKANPIINIYSNEIVKIYTNLAQAQLKLNLYKDAIETLKQARQINNKWIKIYYYEGQAYEGIKEYGEAAASYFEALKIEHDPGLKKLFDEAMQKGKELHSRKQ